MIEDAAAVDALLDALEDDDTAVRKQAIWALMRCIDHDDVDYEELAAKLRKALIGGDEANVEQVDDDLGGFAGGGRRAYPWYL
jgi:hypothetical protein